MIFQVAGSDINLVFERQNIQTEVGIRQLYQTFGFFIIIVIFCIIGAASGSVSGADLPEEIQWQTNLQDPVFSSPRALRGGTYHLAVPGFPMTFRVVGPDSNGSFRSYILDNQLSLINIHPDTGRIIPELATHWAFSADQKTMYFKLDTSARWSDGTPVTAEDYQYCIEFHRSPHIIAPWYNDYYTREIERVTILAPDIIAVTSTRAVPDLHLRLGISPVPVHFFRDLGPDFVRTYNWAVVPNTGAYQISDFKKGKYVTFSRKKDWWAKDLRYFRNRFNVDTVRIDVIRDNNLEWAYFKKGLLETFNLRQPKYWHKKAKNSLFENGYIHKIWFFNDMERYAYGIWLNQDTPVFSDRRVCYAFAHAMNLERVIRQVLRGDYFRLPQAFYGYGRYTDESIRPRAYDIEKVSKYMEAAGWHRGSDGIWSGKPGRFSIPVTYTKEDDTPALSVLRQEALKAGLDLKLDRLDRAAMFKKILEKKHTAAWMGWSTSLRPSYWQGWHSDNAHQPQTNNITNTDDTELDRLIDAYRESLDETVRMRLSRKIQQRIYETGAMVPTFMFPYTRSAFWRWVCLPDSHGTRRTEDLFDPFSSTTGGLFWIDPEILEETRAARKKGDSFPPVNIIDTRFRRESKP